MALEIGPLPPKQVQDLKYYHSDKVDVRLSEVMQNALVVMEYQQGAHEPTSDIVTRRAIIHAVDKSRFIKEEFAALEPVYQQMPFSAPLLQRGAERLNPTRGPSTSRRLSS